MARPITPAEMEAISRVIPTLLACLRDEEERGTAPSVLAVALIGAILAWVDRHTPEGEELDGITRFIAHLRDIALINFEPAPPTVQ